MHTADFNSKHWTAAILKEKRPASDSFCDLLTFYIPFISKQLFSGEASKIFWKINKE